MADNQENRFASEPDEKTVAMNSEMKELAAESLRQGAMISDEDTPYAINQDFEPVEKQDSVFWWVVLGFCLPLIGLILFFIWRRKESSKRKSKASGIAALIGAIFQFTIGIIAVFALGIFSAKVEEDIRPGLSNLVETRTSDEQILYDIVENFNNQSADLASEAGRGYQSITASIEGDDLLAITFTFIETAGMDADTISIIPEDELKEMYAPIASSLYEELFLNEIEGFKMKIVFANSDGTSLLSTVITESDLQAAE